MTHELHNLTNLERISLDDMNARAALLTRVDRKYVVPTDRLDELIALMNPATQVLEIGGKIEQRYASCYFDTPGLHSFMDTAHKRRRRYKVRTRSYLDSELAFLEVKTRGPRGHTVKKRMAYDFAQAGRMELSREGRLWVAERLEAAQCFDGVDRVDSLVPVLSGTYTRSTLLMADGQGRATIDTELHWDSWGHELQAPHIAIIETKSGEAPSELDRLLWANRIRPSRISKYATAMALLTPDLQTNRWTRVIDRFFTTRPTVQQALAA